ncbi:unnamed protein product [Parnassius mnemosyne]|uniref:Uncharacterized protein n=1 Tax=Parnassius mnemosyne TaxID=213953 RepID=A0AAV1K6Z6_9NEOP
MGPALLAAAPRGARRRRQARHHPSQGQCPLPTTPPVPRGGAGSRPPRCGTTRCPTATPSTTSSIARSVPTTHYPACPPRRRWVPPSSLRHHEVPDGDAKHDIIHRKVSAHYPLPRLSPEAALGPALLAAAPRGARRRRQARHHPSQGARHT